MIDEVFSRPEGKTLEFKRDLSSSKPLLKTLVAFANTAGGRLVVVRLRSGSGVADTTSNRTSNRTSNTRMARVTARVKFGGE
jgi:predicted HTH transcriptional regulator